MLCGDMKFPEKLTKAIEAREWSQSRLAKEIGVSQATVSEMTRGQRRPYGDQIFAIAKALGVTCDYLLDDEQDAPGEVELVTEKDKLILANARIVGHDEALRRILYVGTGVAPMYPYDPVQGRPR